MAGVPCPDSQQQRLPTSPTYAGNGGGEPMCPVRWSYGVTTVPDRRVNLLPRTLESLARAGFPSPRLFVDGDKHRDVWETSFPDLELTLRWPRLRTHGNWILALYELYIREPAVDRYAVFQDDFVTYPDLRAYLDRLPYPDGRNKDAGGNVLHPGYWNLYTFPSNQSICPRDGSGREQVGFYESNQYGRGAVALVFNRDAVLDLLSSRHMTDRPMSVDRGHRSVDGGIVDSLKKAGRREYVHNPSLVQHTGQVSVMGSKPHPLATSFRGEEFSALSLLPSSGRV